MICNCKCRQLEWEKELEIIHHQLGADAWGRGGRYFVGCNHDGYYAEHRYNESCLNIAYAAKTLEFVKSECQDHYDYSFRGMKGNKKRKEKQTKLRTYEEIIAKNPDACFFVGTQADYYVDSSMILNQIKDCTEFNFCRPRIYLAINQQDDELETRDYGEEIDYSTLWQQIIDDYFPLESKK